MAVISMKQLLEAGVQDLGKAPEPVQQRVGNGVGILLGDGVKQQQLQRLHICKAVQSRLQEPRLQPLPVSFVYRWICHKISPCYFCRFPVK